MTPDDVERIVANFDRRMDPGSVACAFCGVRALDEPCALVLPLRDLPADHWLRFTSEQRAGLQGFLSILRSYYRDRDDAFYHVHPELLELDRTSGAASARLCSLCGTASKKPSATPPRTSLAAGCDYGLFSRMGLERPSALEALVLADVRT